MTNEAADLIDMKPDELRAACDAARARVAENPDDEEAAERLFTLVSRSIAELEPDYEAQTEVIAPQVLEAAELLRNGKDEDAEMLLRQHLSVVRNDPHAMLLMADIAMQCGFPENAEKILRRSVEVHPRRAPNWLALATHLQNQPGSSGELDRLQEAIDCLDKALAAEPRLYPALSLKSALLIQTRCLHEAESVIDQMLQIDRENASAWLNKAYLLKTRGEFGEAVAAVRTAIALDPTNGAMWWTLADFKRARFFPGDIERMEGPLEAAFMDANRVNVHLALAAAYDQAGNYERAAEHLQFGSALRLEMVPYDRNEIERIIDGAIGTYTQKFFEDRAGFGSSSEAPIFILGMPRSGSTLLEQILASHPSIEGTEELFGIQQIAGEISAPQSDAMVETALANLPLAELEPLGSRYLDVTAFLRKTDRPWFTDKNPDNWRYVGLIKTILPNAKIIDIRRNPLDCCFGNYMQHFLVGGDYSYGFEELASRYSDYVRFMRHFDEVLPGAVHRVIYEDLVDSTEAEVRRLLEYLGLPFDERCLRFFETKRAVLTPSAEQVRQPINRSGIGKSSNYEPWIGGLKLALADILDNWRA